MKHFYVLFKEASLITMLILLLTVQMTHSLWVVSNELLIQLTNHDFTMTV